MSALTCMRKRQYATEQLAQAVIFKIRAKGQDAERLKAYHCATCNRWHLGRSASGARAPLMKAYRDVTGERIE